MQQCFKKQFLIFFTFIAWITPAACIGAVPHFEQANLTSILSPDTVVGNILHYWTDHQIMFLWTVSMILSESCLIIFLFLNVRRRRMAEYLARENEERMKMAALSAGAGLWSIDLVTGNTWATTKVNQLFNISPDRDINYNSILECVHIDDRSLLNDFFQQATLSGEESVIEFRLGSDDGSRWINCRCQFQKKPGMGRLMGTFIDITDRKKMEEMLRFREKELTSLTERLIYSKEEELRKISRDLHDDLAQRLTALAIDTGILEASAMSSEMYLKIHDIKNTLSELSEIIHDLSRQLHPSILEDLGLIDAIKSECRTFSARTGIKVEFSHNGAFHLLPAPVELCIYRVLQEALQNLAKHSGTKMAQVTALRDNDHVQFTVQDFGTGFSPHDIMRNNGVGITSMKERVRLVNGRMSLSSSPGKGTTIRISVPAGEENASAASNYSR
jgi:signal transduction histidine kinase